MNNIYLIGFMGAGKSAVARKLQHFLPFQIVEMDEAIERIEGMTIPEIFEKKGEQGFRTAETQLLSIISKEKNQIISCGGGIVLNPENVEIMKSTGTIVRLDASPEIIYKRISGNNRRPLAAGKSLDEIKEMISAREEYYKNAADITVKSDENSIENVASDIVKELALNGRLN
ncbi:shikimate kinase [Pseudobutyrivibrio sp.]|uniref:shikimate kinase n=1 Tax=Pseudobutyrivibrio sp. TaxID=2014367 RepID=UPI001E0B9D39|nr:shikimate kinase [Pseudobutyrivibrio sp.]MBE5910179.1 shikimate kinase [Pseudobutyrivibrio sp.]